MDDPAGVIASQTNRGFTGHEELDAVGLVHMNGRVYDPLLARFGTPDPTTESPFSTQGWNRYSCVGNSPLNFTDPSGYCFLGCFWKPIFAAVQNLFRSVPVNRQRAFTPDWSAPPRVPSSEHVVIRKPHFHRPEPSRSAGVLHIS